MSPTMQSTPYNFDPLGTKTRWIRRGLFVIYTALLIYGLFRPEGPPSLFKNSDKVLHFLAFAGFAFSTRLAFARESAWKVWGLIIAWAPLSETLQHQVQPSRYFSWLDIVANLSGVAIGALCWYIAYSLYSRYFNRRT